MRGCGNRGLDFMVDESFGTYLLEVNTGPVLKGDYEGDMRMIAGMTEMLFGTGTCSPYIQLQVLV